MNILEKFVHSVFHFTSFLSLTYRSRGRKPRMRKTFYSSSSIPSFFKAFSFQLSCTAIAAQCRCKLNPSTVPFLFSTLFSRLIPNVLNHCLVYPSICLQLSAFSLLSPLNTLLCNSLFPSSNKLLTWDDI